MRTADVCFSPGDGGLVLWGNLLWDVRLPHPVQRFDRFSDGGGACFHPTVGLCTSRMQLIHSLNASRFQPLNLEPSK
jgi:hypothetical protein